MKKEYRLECYENVFAEDYDVYNFETLEQAQDFIRVHKLKQKFGKIKIMHEDFLWETRKSYTFEELNEMGIDLGGLRK